MKQIHNSDKIGLNSQRLKKIDAWMQRYVSEGKFAGTSVLVARDGHIAHLSSAGQRSLTNDLPFETDTIVRIYSMTKPIVSVALMTLVSDGLIHLDATIDRFLPEFTNCQALIPGATSVDQTEACGPPTIQQLLTHTAGFTYSFNPGLLAQHYAEQKIDFGPNSGGLEAMVKRVADVPLAFVPGTQWEYSIGIDIIGRIIEVITGNSLATVLHDRIFTPLGMIDTAFGVADEHLQRFADCYLYQENDPLRLADAAAQSQFRLNGVTTFSGGGGLVSTLSDYFRFAEMLRLDGEFDGTRIISSRIAAFMKSNHLDGDIASMGPQSFAEMPMRGMGFGIGGSVVLQPALSSMPGTIGDFSWGGMASTFFWVDPIEKLTVIFFTQLIPSSTYANRAELKALVHSAIS